MDKLADALVYAINYIDLRDDEGDETYLHEDTKALEWLSHILQQASEAEKDALAAAVKRALAAELAAGAPPDSRWVRGYGTWMQDMFGEEWSGDDRV